MFQDYPLPPSPGCLSWCSSRVDDPLHLPQGLSDPWPHRVPAPLPDRMKQESESVWSKTSPPRAHLKGAQDSGPETTRRKKVVWAATCEREPDCLLATDGLGLSLLFKAMLHYSTLGPHWTHTALFTSFGTKQRYYFAD